MNLGTLVNNIVVLKEQAKALGISFKRLGNLQIVQKQGNRTVVSESIKLSIVKDESNNFYILKSSYDTTQDKAARINQNTKFL